MSLKRPFTLLFVLLITTTLQTAAHAQNSSASAHIYKITSSSCMNEPYTRSLTGFRVNDNELVGIITALHGVADCAEINAFAGDGAQLENLEIASVDIDRDVALLWSPEIMSLSAAGLAAEIEPAITEGDALYVIGYPLNLDAQLPTQDLSLRGMTQLIDLISGDVEIIRSLFRRRSPYMGIQVLSIEGHILPGHSGAPIFDVNNNVVGIGNGGLDLGRVGISWAVPWHQIEWKAISENGAGDFSQADFDRLNELKENSSLFFSFNSFAPPQEKIVEKTVCKTAVGPAYENIENLKDDLLLTAKKQAVGELFGELLHGYTEIENALLTDNRIQTSTAGYVRVAGTPDYKNHEANLGEVCVSIEAYVTAQDLQELKPKLIASDRICENGNLPQQDLKKLAEDRAVIRALTNYDPRLADYEAQLGLLLKEKEFIDGEFEAQTGAYCTAVEGYIFPAEIKALVGSLPPSPSPTPQPPTPPTPQPPTPQPPTPTAEPSMPSGKLAIPLRFGFEPKVYVTTFNGEGINSGDYIAVTQARQPMWTHDGSSIMVNGNINGIQGLFKLDAIGFSEEIIIDRGSARWPIVSPENSEIVLFSERTLDDRLFRREPPDGDGDQIITPVSLNGRPFLTRHLLWSDNNIVVFQGCRVWEVGGEGDCGVWIMHPTNLAPEKIIDGNAAVPMDAKAGWLAYVIAEEGDWEVYIMPLRGPATDAINLTNNDAQDGIPAISPDGDMVAYVSNESGNWAVWTVTIAGQQKQKWFDINPERGSIEVNEWADERMSWSR